MANCWVKGAKNKRTALRYFVLVIPNRVNVSWARANVSWPVEGLCLDTKTRISPEDFSSAAAIAFTTRASSSWSKNSLCRIITCPHQLPLAPPPPKLPPPPENPPPENPPPPPPEPPPQPPPPTYHPPHGLKPRR